MTVRCGQVKSVGKMDEVHIKPPDMRNEERKREADVLMKASSDDLQKMFQQVL
jgi:hypothetical protein